MWIADDRETIRTLGVSGFKQPPARAPTRIVMAHIHLAADDIHLLAQLIGGQCGVHHDVAKNVDGDLRARVRHVDVIDRAVEGCVGVHVTAFILHLFVDDARRAIRGALEEHVFEDVRQSRAEPFAFVDAARRAPRLRGDDWRVVILAHDDGQAVFERGQGDAGGQGRDNVSGVGGRWLGH